MSSTFKTLGDLIGNAINAHLAFAVLFSRLAAGAEEKRCQMLLQDMAANEIQMSERLQAFVRQAEPVTLNCFMQYTLEQNPSMFVAAHTPAHESLSLDEIGQLGEQTHSYLIELMETAWRQVGSQAAKELVETLCQLEKADGRIFTRKTDSTYDM